MASSEIVDSGRFSGHHQKSNFSQTCNLLSQYLKEKGSFGDLSLGINRNFDSTTGTPTATTTMDLLPKIEKSGESESAKPVNFFPQAGKMDVPEKAQMTIFYGGQVIVFNDFPAEKAKEIILLASSNTGNNNKPQQNPKSEESASDMVVSPVNVVPSFGTTLIKERPQCQMPSQPIVSDLPIARRASLTRFLEKRKDRLTTKTPYTTSNPNKQAAGAAAATPKQEGSKAWLGLGAQFPVKTEQI